MVQALHPLIDLGGSQWNTNDAAFLPKGKAISASGRPSSQSSSTGPKVPRQSDVASHSQWLASNVPPAPKISSSSAGWSAEGKCNKQSELDLCKFPSRDLKEMMFRWPPWWPRTEIFSCYVMSYVSYVWWIYVGHPKRYKTYSLYGQGTSLILAWTPWLFMVKLVPLVYLYYSIQQTSEESAPKASLKPNNDKHWWLLQDLALKEDHKSLKITIKA